jgi:hypothetical protein
MTREQLHRSFADSFAADESACITADALSKAEAELQTLFPASFLAFAEKVGAIFTPGILDLVTGGESEVAPPGASFDVQNFFTAEEIVETTRAYHEGGMETWFIAVASDSMGNVFGFRQHTEAPRPDDATLMVFDHDFCKTDVEAESFDAWISSFLTMKKDTQQDAP